MNEATIRAIAEQLNQQDYLKLSSPKYPNRRIINQVAAIISNHLSVSVPQVTRVPVCMCGLDENPRLPRLDILCPKHDGQFPASVPDGGVEARGHCECACHASATACPQCRCIGVTEAAPAGVEAMRQALIAAMHTIESYRHGNVSHGLADEVLPLIHKALESLTPATQEEE